MAEIHVYSMFLCRPVVSRALSSGGRVQPVNLGRDHGQADGNDAD
jgi:hypothetical protein